MVGKQVRPKIICHDGAAAMVLIPKRHDLKFQDRGKDHGRITSDA
jgi:hypothetical protein